jgi:LCP family protein required for cell wall assembly
MRKNQIRLQKQVFLLLILLVSCILSSTMIYLGMTVFRSKLPLFQLIDGKTAVTEPEITENIGPEPMPAPGVIDLDVHRKVDLFMILGSDFRPESGYRTDVLMLVALDRRSGQVSLVSFPRDLWVAIPGFGEERINTVMQKGGFPLLAQTMQTNFGVFPTHYAMIDMEGFLKVIDVLGGIEFETDQVTADDCDSSLEPDRWCEVGPGMVSLDRDWALWYVRARYHSSDFDRLRRTQEVLSAVMDELASPKGFLKLPALFRIYETEVENNLSTNQIISLLRILSGFSSDVDARSYAITSNEATPWITASGANILLPDITAIQAILQEAINFE